MWHTDWLTCVTDEMVLDTTITKINTTSAVVATFDNAVFNRLKCNIWNIQCHSLHFYTNSLKTLLLTTIISALVREYTHTHYLKINSRYLSEFSTTNVCYIRCLLFTSLTPLSIIFFLNWIQDVWLCPCQDYKKLVALFSKY